MSWLKGWLALYSVILNVELFSLGELVVEMKKAREEYLLLLFFYVLMFFSSLFRNKMVKIRKLENHLTR